MSYTVKVIDNIVYQNGVSVATISCGWGMGSCREKKFLIRSRKGNAEAKSFLTHMLKIMTVDELANIVAKTSPATAGAHHGWAMPHLKAWVKKGTITQERLDEIQNYLKEEYSQKMGL